MNKRHYAVNCDAQWYYKTQNATLPYKNQLAAAEHQQIPHIHAITTATNCCKKHNKY
jgi:hypothetical protein